VYCLLGGEAQSMDKAEFCDVRVMGSVTKYIAHVQDVPGLGFPTPSLDQLIMGAPLIIQADFDAWDKKPSDVF
jgi:hypothetical protein